MHTSGSYVSELLMQSETKTVLVLWIIS